MKLTWPQIYDSVAKSASDRWRFPHSVESSSCGAFSFEIRAWDIGPDGTREISDRYNVQRGLVRKAIAYHKGVSVYRDNVLVLPKSESTRDWLGLDLRRVGRVGPRLSTSQIVGFVSISAKDNPRIEDTSDREGLLMCPEVEEFQEIIKAALRIMEVERGQDRIEFNRETPMADLFATISANELIANATDLAKIGAQASAVVPLIRKHGEALNETRQTIQGRFEYYSRLATIGTIAQMLVHEIRNRTTVLGRLVSFAKTELNGLRHPRSSSLLNRADRAVMQLERLANTFAPLASRTFRRGRRQSVLEERIRNCLDLQDMEMRGKSIEYSVPDSETVVLADPGELDAIILNLITNASYWLEQVPANTRRLEFAIEHPTGKAGRVEVWVNDSGPGLDDADVERVFWPGVTRKPGGIGMGLTVASELVAAYGGQTRTLHPGVIGGATFIFDLPCRNAKREE